MFKINPQNYSAFIRIKGRGKAKCLMNEFLLNGPLKNANPLIINNQDSWVFYIDKRKQKICDKIGFNFFKNEKRFKKYSSDFEKYVNFAQKKLIKKYSSILSRISKEEFKIAVKKLSEFWKFYGYTEFIFHDSPYERMLKTKNKILKKNLKKLDALKLEGRKIFNFFVPYGGVLNNILSSISKQFFQNEGDGYFLYYDEIIKLFNGFKIDKKIIAQRKRFYALSGGKKIKHFNYTDSKKVARIFYKYEKKELKNQTKMGIKGDIANPGKAVGKIVIVPMMDAKEAAHIKMNKGDILVAQSTNPDLISLCTKAGAIVANQGGMLSHAAIISRELNIPCIVGTTSATKIFKDGDLVEVDAFQGIIRKINGNYK